MAAPEGNTNSSKTNRLWGDTIRRAVVQGDSERLRRIAEALLTKAEEGDLQAIKELGDRLDGKAAQTIAGDPENPLQLLAAIEWRVAKHSSD
jgi:phage gp29-like protein